MGISSVVWPSCFLGLRFLFCRSLAKERVHRARPGPPSYDHIRAKTPDPIRTPKLSALELDQYYGGGPRGNLQCRMAGRPSCLFEKKKNKNFFLVAEGPAVAVSLSARPHPCKIALLKRVIFWGGEGAAVAIAIVAPSPPNFRMPATCTVAPHPWSSWL